jgi:hypothetical protein
MPLASGEYADFVISTLAADPRVPKTQKISNSRVLVEIKTGKSVLQCRLLLFSVGEGGRHREGERRVEITSTYRGTLRKTPGHKDVVLGVERGKSLLVGLDSRRLNEGGETSNASTFVYLPMFDKLSDEKHFIYLNNRQKLFPAEYQVYMQPDFLVDYLLQQEDLHGFGVKEEPSAPVADEVLEKSTTFERRGSPVNLTYRQQLQLALRKMYVGRLGERLVYKNEVKRLLKAGKPVLSASVDWISQKQPYLGYDIMSFHEDATKEYIEVKASIAKLAQFHFTQNEMNKAKSLGENYRLICVSNVTTKPAFQEIRDPSAAIRKGQLEVLPDDYLVRIVK